MVSSSGCHGSAYSQTRAFFEIGRVFRFSEKDTGGPPVIRFFYKEFFVNKTMILDQFAFQRRYLSMLVDDIPDECICAQPGGVVNHPAWQLGHLAFVADRMVKTLGGTSPLDAAWEARYAPNTTPNPDRAASPSKAELIRVLDDRRSAAAQAFLEASADELAKPNPIARITAALPTVGHLMLFGLVFHESTHLGQLAAWRKATGMPLALLKMG